MLPTSAKEDQEGPEVRNHQDSSSSWLAYGVPAALVLAFLLLLILAQQGAETTAVQLVSLLPVGYAFGAGMVASVNPCGFILLPSYISYILGTEEQGYHEASAARRVFRAVLLGGVATIGFVTVFASVGFIITAGGRWMVAVFPYAGLGIGIAMAALGLWLLSSGRTIGVTAAGLVMAGTDRKLRNVFLFGIGYALGSLSCTLPIFLVVVGSALSSEGFFQAFSQFIAYSLGMGSILVAVSLSVAFLQGNVTLRLRALIPHLHRVSALFLIGAGVYLVYYWVFFAKLFG